MVPILLLIPAVAAVAAALTRAVLGYARKSSLRDVPNERSSHSVPTPRGGGLAIALAAGLGWLALALSGQLDARAAAALLGGGALVAWIGWLDDRHSLSARLRLAVQFVAAIYVTGLLADRLTLPLADGVSMGFPWSAGFAVLYLVWMTNLYNFMDGIDGIAGGQGASVALVLALFLAACGETNLAIAYGVLGAASLGFLPFNWSPARLFMGDVGSGFLGFAFGTLSLLHVQGTLVAYGAEIYLPWVASLAMGVFLVDSGITLLRRLFAGRKVWQAHRDHAYQKAVRAGRTHAQVSLAVIGLNLLWLGPAVALVFNFPQWLWVLLPLACIPLLVAAFALGAGEPDAAAEAP